MAIRLLKITFVAFISLLCLFYTQSRMSSTWTLVTRRLPM